MMAKKSPSAALTADDRLSAEQLLVVFGDQLTTDTSAFRALDKNRDVVLMMEVAEEAEHVPSHRQRTALFLSAMRHFALDLQKKGYRVRYVKIDDPDNGGTFTPELQRAVTSLQPKKILCTHPGEWRVMEMAGSWEKKTGVPVDIHDDDHFYLTPDEFAKWRTGKKSIVLETFYRWMRKRESVLMTTGGKPAGGEWNYDKQNRETFKQTPRTPKPYTPRADTLTREVIETVLKRWPDGYGALDADSFRWPVTRAEALRALEDFIEKRLPLFGKHQDAMWTEDPFLRHSLLSSSVNLHLLNPREIVSAALEAYEKGDAPINSVEGFVRQLLGWREFIRGVYWTEGRGYRKRNFLRQRGDLPDFYWTGETDMKCMSECVRQVLEHGYGHHIQRLMVTGQFALTSGVSPQQISDWYLAMYVDAVDWVTLPNTLGMVMHADGGVVGTKPYAASGAYISRMSNYCEHCRYDPKKRHGENACPVTTFYWDFLNRNHDSFRSNNRMALVMKSLDRIGKEDMVQITTSARRLRRDLGIGSIS